MAKVEMKKLTYTRYRDANGRHVPRGTAGAKTVKEQSRKYYATWYEGRKKIRRPLSTDKGVSHQMVAKLEKELERGRVGLADPFAPHKKTPLLDLVEDYLRWLRQGVKDGAVSAKHYAERERLLTTTLAGLRVGVVRDANERRRVLVEMTLDDVRGVALSAFLRRLECGPRTRDTHRLAAVVFCNWLTTSEGGERLESNPLLKVEVHKSPKGRERRRRRALRPEELRRLFEAARQRPLLEMETIRRGPRKGQRVGKVRPEVRQRMEALGRERALLYKVAALTGLRRGELRELRVRHLRLDAQPAPFVNLPGQFTKNGDPARLLLVPAAAEELRRWVADAGRRVNDPVFVVPTEVVKVLRRDLALAGIDYQDADGRYADFHALRKTTNTMLGLAKVETKVRQLFMRHKDVHLTLESYDDDTMYELSRAVEALGDVDLS